MTKLFTINADEHCVAFNSRAAISQAMDETGVSTLKGFNRLALMIVAQFGHVQGVSVMPGEEELWHLGAMTREDAIFLRRFLIAEEQTTIVDVNEA